MKLPACSLWGGYKGNGVHSFYLKEETGKYYYQGINFYLCIMFKAFRKYIQQENLFDPSDKILLTISGGIDSVVMLELFHRAGYEFGIVHVNFQLRGEESDGDAKLVEGLAEKYSVPFYRTVFDTAGYASKNKLSTQMAARELRYQYFEEIRKAHGYKYIATAHHQDDQVETLFINLLRGTGISGLRGILPKQNHLVRPLLFAKREEIFAFLQKHKLVYREDSSNASVKYLRNKIRHCLLPVLKEIDGNCQDMLAANMKRFAGSEQIYKRHIENVRDELQTVKGNKKYIEIEKLKTYKPLATYLYELLKSYGFLFSQAEDLVQSLGHESGKLFESETHELLKDRDFLIIRKRLNNKDFSEIEVFENDTDICFPICLKMENFLRDAGFKIPVSPQIAALDFDRLKFPLSIRKWEKGDYFYPLGSRFKKKLSDFFIDRKFNLFEKEEVFLLCSGEDIVWIIGHQIDNRFKITDQTKSVFQMQNVS